MRCVMWERYSNHTIHLETKTGKYAGFYNSRWCYTQLPDGWQRETFVVPARVDYVLTGLEVPA